LFCVPFAIMPYGPRAVQIGGYARRFGLQA
jgi:hypothetical protein